MRGAHAISLDSKGRLAIPTKFRDWLRDECDGQLVCTIDIAHPCLLLYPLNEWEEVERKLKTLSSTNPAERRLLTDPDSQQQIAMAIAAAVARFPQESRISFVN